MNFQLLPLRRLSLIRGWLFLAAAITFVVIALTTELDEDGRLFACIFIGLLVLLTWWNFRVASRATEEEQVTFNPELLSTADRARHYRHVLWLCYFLMPVVAVWVAWDLWQLDSKAVSTFRVVYPIGTIYESFGFWPAALFVPACGVWTVIVTKHKLRVAEQALESQQGTTATGAPGSAS